MRSAWFDATYLHARRPSDARVAFFCHEGPTAIPAHLPGVREEEFEDIEIEVLFPTDEESLAPLTPAGFAGSSSKPATASGGRFAWAK